MVKKNKDDIKISQALIKPRFSKPKHTIVFVHGFNSQWQKHEDFFHKLTWGKTKAKTYVFNLPNHGDSSSDENYAKFDDYVKFFVDFFKEKDLKNVILIGHSMGGGIVACGYPEIKDRIKAVILQDPLNRSIYSDLYKRGKFYFDRYMDNKQEDDESKKEKKEEKSLLQSIKEGYASMKEAYNNFVPDDANFKKLIFSLISPFNAKKITKGFKEIEVPTLVVYGENDNIIPADPSLNFFKETIKNVKTEKIPDAAHTPFNENKEQSLKVVKEFLETVK